MIETTQVPCFPLKPETDAPCNPLYPRTTVFYNEKMNAIEVSFHGPEFGTIHILTLDRAGCLLNQLRNAFDLEGIRMGFVADEKESAARRQRIMQHIREAEGAASWRTQGDGHFPTVEEIDSDARSAAIQHGDDETRFEMEYAAVPREAEGA